MLKATIDKFRSRHLICNLGVIDEHDFGDELSCVHFGTPPISLKINYRIKGLAGDYVVFVAVNEACNGLELCWGQETKDDFKVGPIKAIVSDKGIEIECRPSPQFLVSHENMACFLLPVHLAYQCEDQWKISIHESAH